MGRPLSSSPYGITDPKGNPCCLRESVESVPIRPRYNKVRTRSANVGSAAAGWLLVALEPACFPNGNEDISVLPAIAGLIRFSSPFSRLTSMFVALTNQDVVRPVTLAIMPEWKDKRKRSPTLPKPDYARETVIS